MLCDNRLHIWGAAVADLQCVLVEYLIVLVLVVEVFFDDADEFSTNICFDGCIVWRIKPYLLLHPILLI